MSNFDRIMSATIPAGFDVKRNSIDQLIEAFHKPSIFGLNVELQDDSIMGSSFVCSYMPTLSSLSFKTKSHMVGLDKTRKPLVLEYHEEKQIYLRKPLSEALKEALRPVLSGTS